MVLNSFCTAKDTIIQTKYQSTGWENTSTNSTSDKKAVIQNLKATHNNNNNGTARKQIIQLKNGVQN